MKTNPSATLRKAGEYPNRFFDSAVWDHFQYREGDIVIASYAKSGTTWLQQMVAQLIFDGSPDVDVARMSPWLDAVYPDRATRLKLVEAQTHRRVLKTHLPAEFVAFSPQARYIHVARDGRDVAWSLHAHQAAVSQQAQAALDHGAGAMPGHLRVPPPPPESKVDYFRDWLEHDGHPFWPFWGGVRSWWHRRQQPNVLLVHYADLQADPLAQMRRIAAFIGVALDEARVDQLLRHCSFDYMKAHAARFVPLGAGLWKDGGQAFFHSGANGRWQAELTPELSARYEAHAVQQLGQSCARWLAHGSA